MKFLKKNELLKLESEIADSDNNNNTEHIVSGVIEALMVFVGKSVKCESDLRYSGFCTNKL